MFEHETLADVQAHMTDRLITLEEGRNKWRLHGGSEADFKAFVTENRAEIFHGDPITGIEEAWPAEFEG